jgi:hypothetical protein
MSNVIVSMVLGGYQTRGRMSGRMNATIHVVAVCVPIPTIAVYAGTAGLAGWMRKVPKWGCDGITTLERSNSRNKVSPCPFW